MNFGEVPGRRGELEGPRLRVHAIEQRRRSGLCARPPRSCWSSVRRASSSARSARASTAGRSRTACASTRTTTSGRSTKARTWSIKFNQAGRVMMVFGRRKESADAETQAVGERRPAAAARRRAVPPADRRRLGLGGQHLHHRRLRQLARRQVRPERRLGEVVGRARDRARAVPPAARDRDRSQQQHLCRRSLEPAHPGLRHRRASSCGCSRSTCRRTRARERSTATRRPATAWPR